MKNTRKYWLVSLFSMVAAIMCIAGIQQLLPQETALHAQTPLYLESEMTTVTSGESISLRIYDKREWSDAAETLEGSEMVTDEPGESAKIWRLHVPYGLVFDETATVASMLEAVPDNQVPVYQWDEETRLLSIQTEQAVSESTLVLQTINVGTFQVSIASEDEAEAAVIELSVVEQLPTAGTDGLLNLPEEIPYQDEEGIEQFYDEDFEGFAEMEAYSAVNPYALPIEVRTWAELRDAWNNSSVDAVIMMNNITYDSGMLNQRSKSFSLDGNNFELNLRDEMFRVSNSDEANYDIRNISLLTCTRSTVYGIVYAGFDAYTGSSKVTATFTNIRSSQNNQTRIFSGGGAQLVLAGEIYWMTASEMATTGGVEIAANANVWAQKQAVGSDVRSFFWYPKPGLEATSGSRKFVVGENAVANFKMTGTATAYPVVYAYYDELRLKEGATFNGTMPGNAFRSDYDPSDFIADGKNKINFTSLQYGYEPVRFANGTNPTVEKKFYVGPESEIYIIGSTGTTLLNGYSDLDAARRVVTIDSPKNYDFRNLSTTGTQHVASINLKRFEILNSDIDVWKIASNPDSGSDYSVANVTNLTQTRTSGTTASVTSSDATLASYLPTTLVRRISGFNQNPQLVFTPITDADFNIHAKVIIAMVPDKNGMDDQGNINYIPQYASENQAHATIADSHGAVHTDLYTDASGTASVIDNKFNIAGQRVTGSAHRANRDSDELAEYTVIDITPPEPAMVESANNITPITTVINGSGEAGSSVTFTLNGSAMPAWSTTVDASGKWTLPLSTPLTVGDTIQIFLEDNAGKAPEDLTDAPATNSANGNRNPAADTTYHDAVFKAATKVTVSEIKTANVTVHFKDTDGQALTLPVVLTDREVITPINMNNETSVQMGISEVLATSNYTLGAQSWDVTNVQVEINGTEVTYVFTGLLRFGIVSDTVKFKDSYILPFDQVITRENNDWEMNIIDTRSVADNKGKWHVTAKLSDEFKATDASGATLSNVLYYVTEDGTDILIDATNDKRVVGQNIGVKENQVKWSIDKGLELRVPAQAPRDKTYEAVVNWTLNNTY